MKSNNIEGKNAVLEALRADVPLEKLYVLPAGEDSSLGQIVKAARKKDIFIKEI